MIVIQVVVGGNMSRTATVTAIMRRKDSVPMALQAMSLGGSLLERVHLQPNTEVIILEIVKLPVPPQMVLVQ
jgi:hypothetical protein